MTKKDLGYKPDAFEQAIKIFTDGLAKEDKSKKVGLFKRLKNIEDNLVEVGDNDNKVGIFRIIKDIKDKGIKIDNDDEAVRETRERIKKIMDNGVKVNNFDEMKEEITEHVKIFKKQGANVRVDENQINDLIKRISDKEDRDGRYEFPKFIDEYNNYMESIKEFKSLIEKRKREKPGAITPNQKDMINYLNEIKDLVEDFNPKDSGLSKKRKESVASRAKSEGLKILTNKQILNRLPILLAQIQAGNNSKSLKNELRQIIYSLYRLKVLIKTVYDNLIKVIRA